ncbi:hypothetical protein AZG88_28000 [Rhodococcus sp. LB1]|nr:hypothetical protein Pd630_LPD03546 [Rhodococcus opacus PD630]KXX62710.1 hypothetical protein AZG88_28000 [Rhodococcus sp. LB1]PBC57731.1 hypothetical protein CJ177_07620 [Rhodococcus sp. ACPA1]RZK85660.1 MAG: hypothetical protein EOP26_03570 [Rhodococcus sp. (in: high G+C Gram-positive bacteria)]UDH00856.1 hypothetical protein K2Z90_003394 [Rhodococcus opacus PD630]
MVIAVTLIVVVASLGAALAADAMSHRHGREPEPSRAGGSGAAPAPTTRIRNPRWRRTAVRAWTICGAASAIAIALVGLLMSAG